MRWGRGVNEERVCVFKQKTAYEIYQCDWSSDVCSSDLNCSAYDCEYVAIAQQLYATLVTEDKGILKNFPNTALSMKAFVSQS